MKQRNITENNRRTSSAFEASEGPRNVTALFKYFGIVTFFLVFQFHLLENRLKFNRLSVESDSQFLPPTALEQTVAGSCLWEDHPDVSVNNHLQWADKPFKALFRRQGSTRPICDEQSLLAATVKYYVYPQQLLFSNARYYLGDLISNELGTDPRIVPFRHRYDAKFENDIFWSLYNHSRRFDTPDDAELFVIPVPFGAIYFDIKATSDEKSAMFGRIWKKLKTQPAFVKGKPHVLVSMTNPIFSYVHAKNVINEGLDLFYKRVRTVSVARGDDHFATRYVYLNNISSSDDFRGYDELFSQQRPVTQFTFSVGLGGQARHIPLSIPTWEKFDNSTFFIFYHTRTTASACNSTFFRHAPVLNVSSKALPPSSIGWDLHPKQWAIQYATSKFCLVIRGDTPHSHALFNAVKAGCIPVVISDWYPFYSPPFPATLDMRDFCVFISEEEFTRNPEKTLVDLKDLPKEVILNKLKALEWAQRVMIVDHPQSLFALAFVREAMASFSRPISEVLAPSK